ncbi:MAG TPA: GntR family transcriptional regulator [Xanthobacteraceae bacterium]|nr:GntR family transcriptional regulator [Xanthobacteraceae bacterium]
MDALIPVARLQPLRQQSAPLRNRIIAALRSAIETGVFVPGERLTEKDLCDQLGVSRTSLREALRELQADGVLEYASNRSLTVSRISDEIALNVYRIRAALEALVVEQFIESASDAQMGELTDACERVMQAYRSGVLDEILTTKRAFYDCICIGAKNPIAFDMINRLLLRTSFLRRKSLSRRPRHDQSIGELKELLAAIARRDQATAHTLALVHVQNSARSALGQEDL